MLLVHVYFVPDVKIISTKIMEHDLLLILLLEKKSIHNSTNFILPKHILAHHEILDV